MERELNLNLDNVLDAQVCHPSAILWEAALKEGNLILAGVFNGFCLEIHRLEGMPGGDWFSIETGDDGAFILGRDATFQVLQDTLKGLTF